MMRCNKQTNKQKGSGLLAIFIFSMVLMAIILAVVYNLNMDSLSVSSLLKKSQNTNLDDTYLNNILPSKKLSTSIDETFGNSRFVTTPETIEDTFYAKNTNAELFQAEPYLVNYQLKYQFFYKNKIQDTKNLIYNELPNSSLTSYTDKFIALNVPFVNINSMTTAQKTLRLDSEDQILDSQKGYIGYITKDNHALNINLINGLNSSINIPSDLNSNYKISIGWNLVNGRWSIFLAVYDSNGIYTSSTTLSELINDPYHIQTELGNFHRINIPNNSNIISHELAAVKWYFDSGVATPPPLILRKVTKQDGSNTRYDLDIYTCKYNSATKIFSVNSTTSYNSNHNLNNSNIAISVADNLFTLATSNIIIQQGENLLTYNPTTFSLTNETKLNSEPSTNPIIVRENDKNLYYIFAKNSEYYQYNYISGMINGSRSINYPNEVIDKIIAKFGFLFIFTDKYLRVNDFDSNTLDKIALDGTQEYQILRDTDGQIYAGLGCQNGSCNSKLNININGKNNISKSLGLVYIGSNF